jgi:hypothetical protein
LYFLGSMKIFISLNLTFSCLLGAFEIPKGSFNLGQLEQVSKLAAKAKQPISFVIAKKTMTAT